MENRENRCTFWFLFLGVFGFKFAAESFFKPFKSKTMLDKQENKLSMYRVAEKLLDDNSIIWNGTPGFVISKGLFSGKIVAINTAAAQQQAIITGVSTDKNVLKLSLVDKAAPVAAAIIIYASQNNNNELLEAVNFTHTQLIKTRDDLLGGICQNIHTKATENLLALADFGITAGSLTALQAAITAYSVKVPAPGTAQLTKSTATFNLRKLFKETDVILKMQVDRFVLTFKSSNPDFYTAYQKARVIKDLGATHTKFRVLVQDQDGSPIEGATVSLVQNNLVAYSMVTDGLGKQLLIKIKPGIYTIRAEKTGFVKKEQTGVQFKAGKEVRRTASLVAGASNPNNGTAVREGDVASAFVANVSLEGINGSPTTSILIEATNSPIRVYAASTIVGLPGTVFFDVMAGFPITKSSVELTTQTGMDDSKPFLMVQNIGAAPGHYKFTFNNLQV